MDKYSPHPYLVFYKKKYVFDCLNKRLYKLSSQEYYSLKTGKMNEKETKKYRKAGLIFSSKQLSNKINSLVKKSSDPFYFESLHIIPVNSCNLRCKYCFVYCGKEPAHSKIADFSEIKKTINLFFPFLLF